MVRKTIWLFAFAALLLSMIPVMTGCGPKPPCDGATVTQVQSVQDECAAAEDELEAARDERAELEAEVAAAKAEISELEGRPGELAEQLEELRKGSGR